MNSERKPVTSAGSAYRCVSLKGGLRATRGLKSRNQDRKGCSEASDFSGLQHAHDGIIYCGSSCAAFRLGQSKLGSLPKQTLIFDGGNRQWPLPGRLVSDGKRSHENSPLAITVRP